jgi:hypothetical protein
MSTTPPPPPDRPTEPLRPARIVPEPVPAAAVMQERVVAPVPDSSAILVRLEDALDSLRMGLIVVGLLAAAALGVAIYALLHDDTGTRGGSRSGLASDARVSRVNDRVDRLSRQVQGLRQARPAATGGAGAGVSARVDALESTVKTLSARPAPKDPTQAIAQLSGRIDDLRSDVDALKQAQSTTP